MSAPSQDSATAIKPSRIWHAIAAALFVGSLIPAFFLARDGIDTIDLSVDEITNGTVQVRDEQLSVFALRDPTISTRDGKVSDGIRCAVTPPDGGQPIPLDTPSNDLTIDDHDRVGLVPEDLPEGDYRLSCTRGERSMSLDGFGVRSTEGWTQAILMLVAAVVIPGIAGLTAITIAVITAVRRSSARRRAIRPQPPYGPPGYPPPPPTA